MQSKGLIRFTAICLALACLWQLSFSVVTRIQEKKADKYAEKAVSALLEGAEFKAVAEEDKAFYIDSVTKVSNRRYLDSISAEKVYLNYTYKDVKVKDINLGLDLKGGMNVMLQVQLEDLVKALADNSQDPDFLAALSLAKSRSVESRDNFITLFGKAWQETANGRPLAEIFNTLDLKDKVTRQSTDAEVLAVIEGESESAIANSFNVLRNRIDRFGVTQPNIQRLGNTGRILVELPGVKEPERVRKLLQGTASLVFGTTVQYSEIESFLNEANSKLAEILATEEVEVAEESTGDIVADEIQAAGTQDQDEAKFRKENPLFSVLRPSGYSTNACIGFASYADTALVNKYLALPQIKEIFPKEFQAMWTVKPSDQIPGGNYFELVAIKNRNNKAPLDGEVVTEARVQYGEGGSRPEVSMSMNKDGAQTWAHLTKDNIGRQVAIVLDGMVYSYPTVQSEISGGSSQITGNFTLEEAEDLANVLKSGKLPAPATIIQEQVVGPSLGSESINAGLISFAIAFVLVLIYMVLFYQGAGLIADIALLSNVILLFGTLVSFGAVLTLPGIAGLVLTLGMAVDANVIIYERVKEELRAGKGFGKAVADGYKNAYSAIIDGQVTTALTGLVLFLFGSGPVKGFATTLIIGIVTSVLTSIFITRIIIDDRISRGKTVSFDNKLTRNFLQNTHVDFLGKRKITYIISGALVLISIVSIFWKGFTYGVDFTGGRTYVVRFDNDVKAEDVRTAVVNAFNEAAAQDENVSNSAAEVKQFGGDSQMKITTTYKIDQESSEVDAEVENILYTALKGFFKADVSLAEFTSTVDNPNGIVSSDKVGPTIANDMKRDAIIAVIIALFVIFAYIAIRFKNWTWGLGGVTSLAHTAVIVIGFFSLFSGILPFTLDVDQTFIAAILTIIGYAINDNVVIFDRIREYKADHPKALLKDNVNSALNSTLSRTMNTSLTTLVTMIAIAIFGGEVIRGLAVALILGIVIGTYASIFIGTPVMYDVVSAVEKRKAAKASRK